MSKLINLIGKKFGKLAILKQVETDKWGKLYWLCKCDCGNQVVTRGNHLKSGHSKSCGCSTIKHGHYKDGKEAKIYKVWARMIDRCINPNNDYYKDYGGRGITVCEKWKGSFETFVKDMGETPRGKSIDRINNNEGYYKENCRWTTPKQQARNRRSNHQITHDGETHILTVWASRVGISEDTIRMRLKRGWSIRKALSTMV